MDTAERVWRFGGRDPLTAQQGDVLRVGTRGRRRRLSDRIRLTEPVSTTIINHRHIAIATCPWNGSVEVRVAVGQSTFWARKPKPVVLIWRPECGCLGAWFSPTGVSLEEHKELVRQHASQRLLLWQRLALLQARRPIRLLIVSGDDPDSRRLRGFLLETVPKSNLIVSVADNASDARRMVGPADVVLVRSSISATAGTTPTAEASEDVLGAAWREANCIVWDGDAPRARSAARVLTYSGRDATPEALLAAVLDAAYVPSYVQEE